jgi:hypothetical protein
VVVDVQTRDQLRTVVVDQTAPEEDKGVGSLDLGDPMDPRAPAKGRRVDATAPGLSYVQQCVGVVVVVTRLDPGQLLARHGVRVDVFGLLAHAFGGVRSE